MADSDATKAPVLNSDLKAVHTSLIGLAAAIDEAVGNAQTGEEVTALLEKLDDVNDRVVRVGRKLFAAQTASIQQAAQSVTAATEDTKQAIAELDDVNHLVGTITQTLALVDKLIAVVGPMV